MTKHKQPDLTATDIAAERLHMEIEREDHRKPNRTKPLLEMFTEWHTEGSRIYGRRVYRTECRITLPETYQITTEKPMDILPKLPTEMATEKSTKNIPKPKEDSLQMKQTPNRIMCRITEKLRLRSRITITLLPRHEGNRQSIYRLVVGGATNFHRGRRIRGRRSQEKTTGKDHRKISQEKIMGEARSQPRYPPRCP
jgi:hypothetical protein